MRCSMLCSWLDLQHAHVPSVHVFAVVLICPILPQRKDLKGHSGWVLLHYTKMGPFQQQFLGPHQCRLIEPHLPVSQGHRVNQYVRGL